MDSASAKTAAMKSILAPSMTLRGHGKFIPSISWFPDGQRMISGLEDKTARQWDLNTGMAPEIEEARDVFEEEVRVVGVSRDGGWVVTGGGDDSPELKVCEVETGIVKRFQGHSERITCIDISADGRLLVSGAHDFTAQIWDLGTGRLVAGPFRSEDWVGAVRFSTDSKKLAVKSNVGRCLEVWDVDTRTLDMRTGHSRGAGVTYAPVFWTNANKNIFAAFSFTHDHARTIYEFDALTLEIVGAPFGHTKLICGLALSFDGTLLASAGADDTIKLWACESHQLLATFDVQNPRILTLSPDSRKLAYTTYTEDEYNICICDTPPDVLAQASVCKVPQKTVHANFQPSALSDLPNSDATPYPPAMYDDPPTSIKPKAQGPPPTIDSQQSIFLHHRKPFQFSPARTQYTLLGT
ncbi:WD40 repeat-like protein [Suillus weaverae]|nr:WD40 repeat-like protein [Suillus weaverae]